MLICLFFILISIFLTGCMVGPDYHLPKKAVFNRESTTQFVNGHHTEFSQRAAPDKWWTLYHDETLNTLIEEALHANTDLRVACANLEYANANLAEARALLYPSTQLLASYSNLHISAETVVFHKPIPTLPFVNYLVAGGGVILPLDLFGKLRRGIQVAAYDKEATQAAYDLAKITVVAETAVPIWICVQRDIN